MAPLSPSETRQCAGSHTKQGLSCWEQNLNPVSPVLEVVPGAASKPQFPGRGEVRGGKWKYFTGMSLAPPIHHTLGRVGPDFCADSNLFRL